MRFSTIFAAGVMATAVSARPGLFGSSEVALFDDDLDVPGDNPLKLCETPDNWLLDLESVDLSPNPPKPGKKLTVTAKGDLAKEVGEGSKVHLQVKWGLITLINQKADLCDTVKNVNLTCPIKEGKTEITKEIDIPQQIPPGTYNVRADVYTEKEEHITCLTASVEFKVGGASEALFKQGL